MHKFGPAALSLLSLVLLITGRTEAKADMFSETLRDGGIAIVVESPNTTADNTVTVIPSGLANVNDPVTFSTDKQVVRTWMEDLMGDGTHEIFIQLRQPGSGSYGEIRAFSTNGDKSLSEIFVKPPEEKDMKGYMGHDDFEVMENTLVRRYPVYKEGDSNANPTGGYRQFQYKLGKGEASWIFRIDRVVEF